MKFPNIPPYPDPVHTLHSLYGLSFINKLETDEIDLLIGIKKKKSNLDEKNEKL